MIENCTPADVDAAVRPKDLFVCRCGDVGLKSKFSPHWASCRQGGKLRDATDDDKKTFMEYVNYFHEKHGFVPESCRP